MGAGVLSLAWSLAQLGWLFGPPAIIIFAAVTGVSNSILSDCYRSPHPEYGAHRHVSFLQAVRFFLGQYHTTPSIFQYEIKYQKRLIIRLIKQLIKKSVA